MHRIRLTQIFPFLLPLRITTKKWWFYHKMKDESIYGLTKDHEYLDHIVYQYDLPMINPNSGYDICYQYNKVHNLNIASAPLQKLIIKPHQIFSLCRLIRNADQAIPYKDGLITTDETTKPAYGGGLCQLSNMLFWVFLHSPLTIVERYPHNVETIPQDPYMPYGVDATIAEGWCDLKVRNDTDHVYQIDIGFDDANIMHVILRADVKPSSSYMIYNKNLHYHHEGKHLMQSVDVMRRIKDGPTIKDEYLYTNHCEIGYPLTDAHTHLNIGQIMEE